MFTYRFAEAEANQMQGVADSVDKRATVVDNDYVYTGLNLDHVSRASKEPNAVVDGDYIYTGHQQQKTSGQDVIV
jgi:hypothetical protein